MSERFRPVDKGEFAIDPRGLPKITRKIGGRIVQQSLRPLSPEDEELSTMNSLLRGMTQNDLAGSRLSGLGRHLRQGAAGAGTDVNVELEREDNYDLMGYSSPTDQGETFSEDFGSADLLGQPSTRDREEYGDFVEDGYGEGREDQPDSVDAEDIWSLDIFEEIEDTRETGRNKREPVISAKDPLSDLWRGGNTFARRKL